MFNSPVEIVRILLKGKQDQMKRPIPNIRGGSGRWVFSHLAEILRKNKTTNMPKKFKGENTKVTLAKERKSAARELAEQEKKRKEEDEYWRDDDKHVMRKQERMVCVNLQSLNIFSFALMTLFMFRQIRTAKGRTNWIEKWLRS